MPAVEIKNYKLKKLKPVTFKKGRGFKPIIKPNYTKTVKTANQKGSSRKRFFKLFALKNCSVSAAVRLKNRKP